MSLLCAAEATLKCSSLFLQVSSLPAAFVANYFAPTNSVFAPEETVVEVSANIRERPSALLAEQGFVFVLKASFDETAMSMLERRKAQRSAQEIDPVSAAGRILSLQSRLCEVFR